LSTHFQQLVVTVGKQSADAVSELLTDRGAMAVTVESADEEELFDAAAPSEPGWENQKLTALFDSSFRSCALLQDLSNRSDVRGAHMERVQNKNWERSWLDQFEPIRIDRKLWVCPSWLNPPDPSAINLSIDPGLAFGTGTHPTTHLCLEYLSKQDLKGKQVIDFGCGSGILAIAALAMGADHAIGIDIDERALIAAERNAAINGVSDRFETCLPANIDGRDLTGSADVLIANILAGTLVELHDTLVPLGAKSCLILLSGILQDQGDSVISRYGSEFSIEIEQRDDWLLLCGQRTQYQL